MSNLNGYIKLHRKLLSWEWYSDINVRVLFFHCLLRANHKSEKWQGIELKAGEFVTSYAHLAKECGLTEQQARTALDKLKITREVTCKSTSRYTVIAINNWNLYQTNNTNSNKQITNEQHTNNNRQEYKEVKEYKEKKNIDIFCNSDFEKCFKIYSQNCPNLIPINYEKRSRVILDELRYFLDEIDYDFSYFLNLCQKANDLEKIVDSRIDFRSMVRNHIGITNGKYSAKSGTTQERKNAAMTDFFAKKREEEKRKKELNSG